MDVVATSIFVFFFLLITFVGFIAVRWHKAALTTLHEWGLGGRRFGTFITWFLIGGDVYTAYTFIAVPGLMFGAGAIGFFAVPYTIIVYPLLFLLFPPLWRVCQKYGYVTTSDFVRARYDNRYLSLMLAITGIVATMPYIALQLVGIQVVIAGLGFHAHGLEADIPIIIAFLILALFTYTSGLRAPALIAIIKDTMLYITIIIAIIYIPYKLGGFGAIFSKVPLHKLLLTAPAHNSLGQYSAYATLALGSALALFLYPHAVTGILSANSDKNIQRNAVILPAYSLLLGLIALLGYMALALGVDKMPQFATYFSEYKTSFAVPALFIVLFPSWFIGFAFAAIAIGALVPAAIMSIAAANLFTRNIYREFFNLNCSEEHEAFVAKLISLIVKIGALLFVILLPLQYAIQFQLLGGILIIQTFPAIIFGLYTRWFDSRALLLGWLVGIISGTWAAAILAFKSSVYPLHLFGYVIPGYAALYSLLLNILVTIVVTAALRLIGFTNTNRELAF